MNPDNLFFTSDHHWNHANMIKYERHMFRSVEQMNLHMIYSWNSIVPKNADVFHLGDIGHAPKDKLYDILNELHGRIYLIKGNHDTFNQKIKSRFEFIKDYHEIKVKDTDALTPNGKQKIVLSHYAFRVWNQHHYGSWMLFGHSHGNLKDEGRKSLDVGVDCNFFKPLSYNVIKHRMKDRIISKLDHHEYKEE